MSVTRRNFIALAAAMMLALPAAVSSFVIVIPPEAAGGGGGDPEALLTLGNESLAENGGTMTFQVSRSADGDGIIAYDYRTVGITAVPDVDYEHIRGSSWISASETIDHDVTILNDGATESTETFTFEVFNVRYLDP